MPESYTIEAQDPGDIVVQVDGLMFPVKSLTWEKTTDVTEEYGTGSHQTYGLTVGKIGYKGSFTVGTWIKRTTKEDLVRRLTNQSNEGIPKFFNIVLFDRQQVDSPAGSGGVPTGTAIEKFIDCLLSGDSGDIGEPGTTITRTYPFTASRKDPK